jgi:HNH endonuclease
MPPNREITPPRKRCDPVGSCIYCGARGPAVVLHEEHVIPYGIGGTLILPDSSCIDCEKITSAIERQCLRCMFGDMRSTREALQRRKRKEPYKPRPMLIEIDGHTEVHNDPSPSTRINTATMCTFLGPPGILLGM